MRSWGGGVVVDGDVGDGVGLFRMIAAAGSPTLVSCVLILSAVKVVLSVSADNLSGTLMEVSTRILSARRWRRRSAVMASILSIVTFATDTPAASARACLNLVCASDVKAATDMGSDSTILITTGGDGEGRGVVGARVGECVVGVGVGVGVGVCVVLGVGVDENRADVST